MHRRSLIAAVAACLLLSSTTAALADRADDVVEWLSDQGYTGIEVSRTLLGRARVLAWRDGLQRELIINPRTGEILRDVWLGPDGNVRVLGERSGEGGKSEDGGSNGGDEPHDEDDHSGEGEHEGEHSGEDDSGSGSDDDEK